MTDEDIKIVETPLAIYINGVKCFRGSHGIIFNWKTQQPHVYEIIKQMRGYSLTRNEKLLYKDGNRSNILPSNLLIVSRQDWETPQQLGQRVRQAKNRKYLRQMPIRERIPDLLTRKCNSRTPLEKQIERVQRHVDEYWSAHWQEGLSVAILQEVAKQMIDLLCPDVTMQDVILHEPTVSLGKRMRKAGKTDGVSAPKR